MSTPLFLGKQQCRDICNIDELIEYIKENFCISLDKDHLKWHIKNTELYFHEIMGKVYDEYNTYYEEIK